MDDIAFLTVRRKNGTVDVVSQPDGWYIYGRGKHSTMKMYIPRCQRYTCDGPKAQPVCTKIHRGGGHLNRHHQFNEGGVPVSHALSYCHGGHDVRIEALVFFIAKTYGPAVR